MKLAKKWWFTLPVILILVYISGPHPANPQYETQFPVFPSNLDSLNEWIQKKESDTAIKANNQAQIIWANDSVHTPTNYAIVYLPGFTASQMEGDPVHRAIAKEFGCNLYLARLSDHGLKNDDAFLNLTADRYWNSARDALAIGKKLGKKIIVMGTSTGGTQALQLAATYPDLVDALILMSPNIAINDPSAWLLNKPWGLQIARLVIGNQYMTTPDQSPSFKKYWYSHYRLEGVVALQEMLETSMTKENFQKIKQPTLLLYYYKDDQHQDPVVKVSAMLEMFDQLGTDAQHKKSIAMPQTGDHVIGSPIKSKDVTGVTEQIRLFMKSTILID